jgi:acetate---CoA ligase (ADP-forming)
MRGVKPSASNETSRAALRALFEPRTVAVIGASRRPGKLGYAVVANLISAGFPGLIYPINPAGGEIAGHACLRAIAELPDEVDCAMLVVPASETVAALAACAERGVRSAIIGASGFAEIGTAEGRKRQDDAAAIARRAGMRLLGPNTNGIYNTTARLSLGYNAAHAYEIAPGPVSIISHSGALFGGFVRTLRGFGVGLAKFVPVGNEADIDMLEIIDCCVEDDATRVIGLAIEALSDGEQFRHLALKAAERGKRIVALKVGRSPVGIGAALAHSSRLAGGARAYEALFAACGVASVRSVEALGATCALLARQPERPGDARLVCITTSGAGGALLADHAAERNLPLAGDASGEWEGEAGAAIAHLPARGHLRNPIDAGSLVEWGDLDQIFQILERDGLLGPCAVYAHIAPNPMQDRTLLEMLRLRKQRTRAPIVVIAPGGLEPDLEQQYQDAGFPVFHETALGFDALAAQLTVGEPARFANLNAPSETATRAAARLGQIDAHVFSEAASAEILSQVGVPMVASRDATTLAQARAAAEAVGYPVVLKAMVPGVAHKNAAGLVITAIGDAAGLDRAHATLAERTQEQSGVSFLLQPMVSAKHELIVGVARQAALGHFLIFGLGGLHAELLDTVLLLPIELEVAAMRARIAASRLGMLLGEAAERLTSILTGLQELIRAAGTQIESIDLNPVIVTQAGDLVAVDALIVCRTAA